MFDFPTGTEIIGKWLLIRSVTGNVSAQMAQILLDKVTMNIQSVETKSANASYCLPPIRIFIS